MDSDGVDTLLIWFPYAEKLVIDTLAVVGSYIQGSSAHYTVYRDAKTQSLAPVCRAKAERFWTVAVNFPPETVYLKKASGISSPKQKSNHQAQNSRSTRAFPRTHNPRSNITIISVRQTRGKRRAPCRVHIVNHHEAQGAASEGNLLGGGGDVVTQGGTGGGGLHIVPEADHAYYRWPSVLAEPAVHAAGAVAGSRVCGVG